MGHWNRDIQCCHKLEAMSPIPVLIESGEVMNSRKWRYFGITFVVFVLTFSLMIFEQGGFDSMGPGGVAILMVAFAAVGLLIYRFVRGNSEDPL